MFRNKGRRFSNNGFSLTEVMISVSIVGILSAVAIPTYKKHFRRAKIAEAHLGLADLHKSMQAHFLQHRWYNANIDQLTSDAKFTDSKSRAIYGFNANQYTGGTFPTCKTTNEDCFTTHGEGNDLNVTPADILFERACPQVSFGSLVKCSFPIPSYDPRSGDPKASDFTWGRPTRYEAHAVMDIDNDGELTVFGVNETGTIFQLCNDGDSVEVAGSYTGALAGDVICSRP